MISEDIRLLIADDHVLFREGLKALLSATSGIEIVGETATGAETVAMADELQPDVILMDINMPDMNGLEATRRILQNKPAIGIIMVTMMEDDASLFFAMRAGARGYVLKGAHPEELLQVVQAVAGGQAVFGAPVATRIMKFFQTVKTYPEASEPEEAFPELTPRELDVLELIAQGANNSQITEQLAVTVKTVRNHITSIFSKLQVADRAQAIVRARNAGLGD